MRQCLTAVLVVVFVACVNPPDVPVCEGECEVTTQVFSAKGEYRSPNYVSDVPQGAALLAQNLVVARPDIYESHRGEERLPGAFIGGADVQFLTEFRGVLIGYSAGVLARYNGGTGTWVAYNGTYFKPEGPLTDDEGELIPGRIIFHQAGDSLYFTTSVGVYRLEDPLSQPELSGVVQALSSTAALSVGVGTALPPESAMAYRFVWGKRTARGRIILGAPSGRVVAYNTSTTDTKDVILTVPVPDEVRAVTGYFLQAYRSEISPITSAPSDEMALVYERAVIDMAPTGDHVFTDIDPDPQGPAAYFAPSVGSLTDSKYRPPLSTDVITFNGTTVYLNAKNPQSITMTLLGVDGPNALNTGNGLIFTFADGTEEVYAADFPTATPPDEFLLDRSADLSPSQKTANTANNLARAISARPGGRLWGQYISDDNGPPGGIRVEARSLDEQVINVRAIESGSMWAPALPGILRVSAGQMSRSGAGIVTVFVTPTFAGSSHGLEVGQQIEVLNQFSVPGDAVKFPPGIKTITAVPTNDSFRYAEAGPVATTTGTAFVQTLGTVTTEAETFGVAWSPLQEPDAVPVLQNAQTGNPDLPVLRAILLDGSLYLLKRDGLYRLQGNTPNSLQVDAIDTTVSFIAPWASWTLGGRAYALTTEGLKVWSDSAKPQPASIPIEQDLLDAISRYRLSVDTLAYVVNYESERRLYLAMPTSLSDVSAQYFHVYSYLTDTWTRYMRPSNTAIISPELNRMVIAPPNSPQLLRERKTRTNADFQGPDGEPIQVDLQYAAQIGGNAVDSKHWSRFYFHFEDEAPTQVTASFATEITTTPQVIPIPGSTTVTAGVLETLVPPETARSRYLYPRIQHAVAQEPFRLLGYTVRHRNYRHQ